MATAAAIVVLSTCAPINHASAGGGISHERRGANEREDAEMAHQVQQRSREHVTAVSAQKECRKLERHGRGEQPARQNDDALRPLAEPGAVGDEPCAAEQHACADTETQDRDVQAVEECPQCPLAILGREADARVVQAERPREG